MDDWAYLTEPRRWNDTPHNLARTVATASLEDLAAPVAQAIESLRPDALLTVGPDGLTGHPDHIACHDAVRHALIQSAHTPRVALGAVLDRRAVHVGYETAATTLGQTVGTGKVAGAHLDHATVTITGPAGTESRRRRALDEYMPGLGTAGPLGLDAERIGTGDSALLRFVLDTLGWDRDHYVRCS